MKMCSVGDDNFENEVDKCMPLKGKLQISNIKCNKCKDNQPCVVLRNKDVYCKDCFLAGTTHKFKALLGKHRAIRSNDRVLIDHKIGHPGTALLHFLRTGFDQPTYRKLRFIPVVLFVEDQLHLTRKERQDVIENVKREVERQNFNVQFISFSAYVSNNGSIDNLIKAHIDVTEDDKDILGNIINRKTSKTNKNDIIHIFRRQILVEAAKSLECKFIFTPEISMDVASQLLTNISLGRGSHVPIDTGFCDDRDADVKILRPLRLFDIKELAYYNFLNKLEPICIRQLHENPYSSVQDLMRKFVSDLQTNYPATVATILKTGDKLALDTNGGQEKHCRLCKANLARKGDELSSAESTRFSHWVSTQTPDYSVPSQDRYQTTLETFDNKSLTSYCYSCSKIADHIQPT